MSLKFGRINEDFEKIILKIKKSARKDNGQPKISLRCWKTFFII